MTEVNKKYRLNSMEEPTDDIPEWARMLLK
jgi:hypothetical protein